MLHFCSYLIGKLLKKFKKISTTAHIWPLYGGYTEWDFFIIIFFFLGGGGGGGARGYLLAPLIILD